MIESTDFYNDKLIDQDHISSLMQIIGHDALKTIIATYKKDADSKLPELLSQSHEGDFEHISQLSHSLKSASANIGLNQLSRIFEAIENAANKKDRASIITLSDSLLALYEESLNALQVS